MNNTIQIVHIVSEVVVLSSVCFYFINKNQQIFSRIEELESKIAHQEEILQNHNRLLVETLQNVNILKKELKQQHRTKSTKKTNENEVKDGEVQTISSSFPIDDKILSENIVMNDQVYMMIAPFASIEETVPTRNDVVQEIIDDNDLDHELEDELKDLM